MSGAANIRGILYQVARGIERAISLYIGEKPGRAKEDPSVTIVLESEGGDHQIHSQAEVLVEQLKLRSNFTWNAQKVVREVFHDFLRARDIDHHHIRYRLVSDATSTSKKDVEQEIHAASAETLISWLDAKKRKRLLEDRREGLGPDLRFIAARFEFQHLTQHDLEAEARKLLKPLTGTDLEANEVLTTLTGVVTRLSGEGGLSCRPIELLERAGLAGILIAPADVRTRLGEALSNPASESAPPRWRWGLIPQEAKVVLHGPDQALLSEGLRALAHQALEASSFPVVDKAGRFDDARDNLESRLSEEILRSGTTERLKGLASRLHRAGGHRLWIGFDGLRLDEIDRPRDWNIPSNVQVVWTTTAAPPAGVKAIRIEPPPSPEPSLSELHRFGIDWRTIAPEARTLLHLTGAAKALRALDPAERRLPRTEYRILEILWANLPTEQQCILRDHTWAHAIEGQAATWTDTDAQPLANRGWLRHDPKAGWAFTEGRLIAWTVAQEAVTRWKQGTLDLPALASIQPTWDLAYLPGYLIWLGREARDTGQELLATHTLLAYDRIHLGTPLHKLAGEVGASLVPTAIELSIAVEGKGESWRGDQLMGELLDRFPDELHPWARRAVDRPMTRQMALSVLRKAPGPELFEKLWELHQDDPWDEGDDGTLVTAAAALWSRPDALVKLAQEASPSPSPSEWYTLLHGFRQSTLRDLWSQIGPPIASVMRGSPAHWATQCTRLQLNEEVVWLEQNRKDSQCMQALVRLAPRRALAWVAEKREQPGRWWPDLLHTEPAAALAALLDVEGDIEFSLSAFEAGEVVDALCIQRLVGILSQALNALTPKRRLPTEGHWALRALASVTSPEGLACLQACDPELSRQLAALPSLQPRRGGGWDPEEEAAGLLLLRLPGMGLGQFVDSRLGAGWPLNLKALKWLGACPEGVAAEGLRNLLGDPDLSQEAAATMVELGLADELASAFPDVFLIELVPSAQWRSPGGELAVAARARTVLEQADDEAEVIRALGVVTLWGSDTDLPLLYARLQDHRILVADRAAEGLAARGENNEVLLETVRRLLVATHRAHMRFGDLAAQTGSSLYARNEVPEGERDLQEGTEDEVTTRLLHRATAEGSRGRLVNALGMLARRFPQRAVAEASWWLASSHPDRHGLPGFLARRDPGRCLEVVARQAPQEPSRQVRREMAQALASLADRAAVLATIQGVLAMVVADEAGIRWLDIQARIAGAELAAWQPEAEPSSWLKDRWLHDSEWRVRLAAKDCYLAHLRAGHLRNWLAQASAEPPALQWRAVLGVGEVLRQSPDLPLAADAWNRIWEVASPRLQATIEEAEGRCKLETSGRKDGLPGPSSLIFKSR